ncbi:hypothetical protein ACRWTA_14935 [Escherichia coli]|uniref:hypothetical protein n=1 Tax=Escherichia coli TaxID=562 RepID=UPI00133112D2|nr:hypothetical protein [Escherichia coli]MDZ8441575.1 hypothetical protein [Escherichia coli]MDZ8496300.1 hypothetical protein [Escherichia coli]MDZ8829901.1 hypothetical protein [Escherichia coli]BEC59365.1 hypothetical protein VEE55_05640 [Escherichia coli]BEC88947.1 hypothetical protein VEE61_20270 [Escherichia coli]
MGKIKYIIATIIATTLTTHATTKETYQTKEPNKKNISTRIISQEHYKVAEKRADEIEKLKKEEAKMAEKSKLKETQANTGKLNN